MKRQVHPPRALRSPWHSVRKRAGRVFAIAGRTELGRGLWMVGITVVIALS